MQIFPLTVGDGPHGEGKLLAGVHMSTSNMWREGSNVQKGIHPKHQGILQ